MQPADTDLVAHLEPPEFIVGIAAGAGGLEAIQLMFGAIPTDMGAAFIICRHLQSGHSDPLADLLCTQTSMPVVQAESGTVVRAGRVHLVAPDARMILLKDRLVPFPADADADEDTELNISPIDILLHSLAASAGPAAIAVMLSGQVQDGVRGCLSIQSHGGLVLAQHPESTEFAEMPRRVIEANLASAIAPPVALADLIGRHVGEPRTSEVEPDGPRGDEEALMRIATLLTARFAIDVRAYRPSLVAKRVRRRLAISNAPSLKDYADHLNANDDELLALHNDLLIRVTEFFRDPEAFAALERNVLPALIERMSAEHPIRIWVPACASGEEAYSMAMLLLDQSERAGKCANVDIIASDRHVQAIEQGRLGIYSLKRLGHAPKDLVERFTETNGDQVDVGTDLRRHVTFFEQDILKAPPPDDVDLVSCRNLLIYLAPEAQERALFACHDALKPGGFLFLGSSEQPGSQIADLETINSKWRIYRKAEEPPVNQALTKLSAAYRRKPTEPILPADDSPDLRPPSLQSAQAGSASEPSGSVDPALLEHQRMLESTIDTLLATNETLRQRNDDLRAENQRLERAHVALDDIATMIAHDLKTPLFAIDQLTHRLQATLAASKTDDEAADGLQSIQHRIAGLSQVVNDLLAYAREGSADKAGLKPLDFADLLRETLTLIGLPKGIRVVIKPPSLQITTWRIPLACIFRSLLGQAIERIGDASGTIRIDAAPTQQALKITIADNGAHASERMSDLGLAIVRQFLETTGGELTTGVNPSGSGRHVRFTWPIGSSASLDPAAERSSST